MTVKSYLKRLLLKALPNRLKELIFSEMCSLEANRLERKHMEMVSMEWSLKNMERAGFHPHYILDVGAYEGQWTGMAKGIFPQANFLMIEPQEAKAEYLRRVADRFSGSVSYSLSLLGAESGKKIPFYEMESGSSVLWEESSFPRREVIKETVSLDDCLERIGWKRTDFMKLDTQGYELEVLKGARIALEGVEAVLTEVSLLDVNRGAPLLHDMISFMKDRHFLAYDICSFAMRRPLDQALWQIDMIFVKESSRLLAHKSFDIPATIEENRKTCRASV